MNVLSLAASTTGIIFASTFPIFAQAISTPLGVLHMKMSIVEAEAALGAKSYLTDHGAILLESSFNGRKYYISFNCLDRNPDRISNKDLRCDKEAMKPMIITVIYTNEISVDIRPREATKILEEFGLSNINAKHENHCSSWNTKATSISAGLICSRWGIRLRNREIYSGFESFGFGGFTRCTASCF